MLLKSMCEKCHYYSCWERYPVMLKSLGKYYLFQNFTSASRGASWDNEVVRFCLEMCISAYAVLIKLATQIKAQEPLNRFSRVRRHLPITWF